MQNANRSLERYGKKMQKVGTALTVGLTAPLTAFAAVAVKNFDTQAKAIAQVNAGLKTTGGLVGFTTEQLQAQASALQNNSLFGDEAILKDVTAQLLTFTSIAGEQFSRTQQAALDLSTRLDGDLKSSAIQLGKALNDPVANLSALSRSGIQFTQEQKNTVKSLQQTNRLAEAQTIILDELEKQYGGSAAAAAQAGLGPFTQLKNILGDITEDFGEIILEGIKPFIESLKGIALRFKSLSPETKKFIVVLGGIAAAAGPLLAIAGTILPALGTGFALLTGPIGLVVAGVTAIAVVIYKNWEPIKKTLVDIANYFIDLYNESTAFRVAVEASVATFKILYEVGKFAFEALKSFLGNLVDQFKNGFGTIGEIIKAVFTGNLDQLPAIIKNASSRGIDTFGELTDSLGADWDNLMSGIEQVTNESLTRITSKKKLAFIESNVDASGITAAVEKATVLGLQKGASGGSGTGSLVRERQKEFAPASQGADFASAQAGIAAALEESAMGGGYQLFRDQLELARQEMVAFQTQAEKFAQIGDAVGGSVANAFANMSRGIINSFTDAETGFGRFAQGLASTVSQLIATYLAQSISASIAGASASGAATGPAAIFTTPAFIATAISGVIGAFASIPRFETGGVVGGNSRVGDKILARVNSGEVILNERQQDNLINQLEGGGGTMTHVVQMVQKGNDLVGVLKIANNKNQAFGG